MSNNVAYETWPIDSINPVPWNPRVSLTPHDAEWKQIEQSLNAFGLVVPLVVNRLTGNLLSGHQRLAVLAHAGHTQIPVAVVSVAVDDEKQINMAMNAVRGRWDEEILAGVLDYLADAGLAHLTGFTSEEFARYTGELAATFGADGPPLLDDTGHDPAAVADDMAVEALAVADPADTPAPIMVACPNCGEEQPA